MSLQSSSILLWSSAVPLTTRCLPITCRLQRQFNSESLSPAGAQPDSCQSNTDVSSPLQLAERKGCFWFSLFFLPSDNVENIFFKNTLTLFLIAKTAKKSCGISRHTGFPLFHSAVPRCLDSLHGLCWHFDWASCTALWTSCSQLPSVFSTHRNAVLA